MSKPEKMVDTFKERFSTVFRSRHRPRLPSHTPDFETPDFDTLDLNIRTLSTILKEMSAADAPTSTRENVPLFLRDIATLLNSGSSDDRQVKQVVAVSGAIEADGVKTLVVVQNSPNAIQNRSEPFSLTFTPVEKNPLTFEEILETRTDDRTFEQHIADLLGLIHSVDLKNKDQTTDFCIFVTIRCCWKLHFRLKLGKKRWRRPLSTMLKTWTAAPGDTVESFVPTRPMWASTFSTVDKEMKKRRSDDEWEFSIETAHLWASVLGTLLDEIEARIQKYKVDAGKHKSSGQDRKKERPWDPTHLIKGIFWLYHMLFEFMMDHKNVVKALLAIPSLAALFTPNDDHDDDDEDDLAPEPQESPQDSIYRYLESVVAWQHAAQRLLQKRYWATFTKISVSVVHVTGFRSDVLPADAIISGLLKRYPLSKDLIETTTSYLTSKAPSFFHGTVHAEATLMGLVSHPFLDDLEQKRSNAAKAFDPVETASLLPRGMVKAIAVGQKCCCCCEKLSLIINPPISIPGSHGTIYPWRPPQIGISLAVLEKLEELLWARLHRALCDHSCQSSGSSFIPSSDEDVVDISTLGLSMSF